MRGFRIELVGRNQPTVGPWNILGHLWIHETILVLTAADWPPNQADASADTRFLALICIGQADSSNLRL